MPLENTQCQIGSIVGVACPSSLKYVDVVFVALQCAGGDGEGHNIPARRGGFMRRAPSSLLWMGLDGGREIVLGTPRMTNGQWLMGKNKINCVGSSIFKLWLAVIPRDEHEAKRK